MCDWAWAMETTGDEASLRSAARAWVWCLGAPAASSAKKAKTAGGAKKKGGGKQGSMMSFFGKK